MERIPPGGPVNIVLLGKTGHGKSATANSIFGEKKFNSRRSSKSVTSACQLEKGDVGGRIIYLVDTPGTMDTHNPDPMLDEIGTAIAYRPEGFHAFLLVLRPDVRMTTEEWTTIILLKKLFGEDVLLKYTVLVFTHGDDVMSDDDMMGKTLLDYLESQETNLRNLVKECNNRCVLINNREKDPGILRKQVIDIISMVDKVVKDNSNKMYTSELFTFAQMRLKEERDKHAKEQERIKKEKEDLEKQTKEQLQKIKQLEQDAKISDENAKKQEEITKIIMEEIKCKEEKLKKDQKKLDDDEKALEATVGKDVGREAKRSGKSCFPPDALVKLQDGRFIAMADLQVGHKVLSSVSNEKLEYSEIYFFAHLDPESRSQYICISTSMHKLKLTPGHHIFIIRNVNTTDTVPAEHIKIGDRVVVFNEATSSLQEEIVTNLTRSSEVGIYAPITMSGTIIVDNVLTSCYVDIVPPKISHTLLWPVRKLYQLSPSLSAWVNMERKDGMPAWVKRIVDSFLRWRK